MKMISKYGCFRLLAVLIAGVLGSHVAIGAPTDGAQLLARRAQLQAELQEQSFGEPLVLRSQDDGKRLEGEVYAELGQPMERIRSMLGSGESVCGMLFLHLNVRSCLSEQTSEGLVLHMAAGPKQGATPATTYRMDYRMVVEATKADYLRVSLKAQRGPLGTYDYRIVFEAAPVDAQRSFLRVGYAYGYGSLAKMAYGLYLTTVGRTKIGFTVLGRGADGAPQYIQGERGSMERNVVRNYLALQAYTSVPTGSIQVQTEARLRTWFALTERHAAQLHEMDLAQYLEIKHEDLKDMAAAASLR